MPDDELIERYIGFDPRRAGRAPLIDYQREQMISARLKPLRGA